MEEKASIKGRGVLPTAEVRAKNTTRRFSSASLSPSEEGPLGVPVQTAIRPEAVKAPSSPNLPSFQETKPAPSVLVQGPANIEAWMDHQTGGLLQIRVVDSGHMLGLSLMATSAMAPRLAKAAGDLQDILDRVSREDGEIRLHHDGGAVSATRLGHDSPSTQPKSVEIHAFVPGIGQASMASGFEA